MNALIIILACLLGAQPESLPGNPFIVVDKQAMTLSLMAPDSTLIKSYPIACGTNYGNKTRNGDRKTPEGRFTINEILNSRGLTHDFGDGKGPVRNAYGPWFLRLDVPCRRDIGIHGTHLPESIGTRATEGCIRLTNEDITDLRQRVRVGTVVIILPDKIQE
ncbi:MAG: L,D-transpeptidase [Bacteroidales bacterium]|nr:L,D-transpeptidase [Bacteroidales bacterium]